MPTTKQTADIRCDTCERPGSVPVWIFRTEPFRISVSGMRTNFWPLDAEWGVCQTCKDDVLADRYTEVLDRRRAEARREADAEVIPLPEVAIVNGIKVLDAILAAFFDCRQKMYGRPFDAVDMAEAITEVAERGHRAGPRW